MFNRLLYVILDMVIFQIFIKENRGSFSTCLSKLRFFGKPTHSVVVCVVVDAYSKSIDGIKKSVE